MRKRNKKQIDFTSPVTTVNKEREKVDVILEPFPSICSSQVCCMCMHHACVQLKKTATRVTALCDKFSVDMMQTTTASRQEERERNK